MKLEQDGTMQHKDIISVFVITGLLLSLPLIAMQFTDEVDWGTFDFVVMGTLLISIGLLVVLALRKIKSTNHRVVAVATLLLALFLIWAELAVGIFGTPFAGS